MNVLVVAPNWIGDMLMAQPLLRLIKDDQKAHLTVLAPAWVAPVARVMPEVDAIIETTLRHGRLELGARLALARRIRGERFERAFVLPNSFKSALIPWLARIPQRVGFRGEARSGLLTTVLPRPHRDLPMTARYARLIRPDEPGLAPPLLVVDPARQAATCRKFGLDGARPFVALCPGAEFGPAKQWPARHYARLAELLHAQNGERELILLGSAADNPLAQEIATAARAPVRPLAGQTALDEAIDLIASAQAVVSNDSGLMHIAAALGRPQVALFGSTDPRHTPPRSARAQVLWLHLDCSPCFRRVCPLGHLNCLQQIEPERVKAALDLAIAP